jgi:hypothetical protein
MREHERPPNRRVGAVLFIPWRGRMVPLSFGTAISVRGALLPTGRTLSRVELAQDSGQVLVATRSVPRPTGGSYCGVSAGGTAFAPHHFL